MAPAPASPRPGLAYGTALGLAVLALALHLPGLTGPFTDGQRGNCGAMFALMARNAAALGFAEGGLVPVLNPVPPGPGGRLETYTHHPPGLPWLVMAAGALPVGVETAARLVALALTLLAALLAADIAARLAGGRAAWATGLLMLALPAGLHHGLLVNYETMALPPLLYLTRVLALREGRAALAGVWAGGSDWIALTPLVLLVRGGCRARWWRAAIGGGLAVTAVFLLGQWRSETATSGALGQGLLATFLNPAFTWERFGVQVGGFLGTLYGWALVPAVAALVLLPGRDATWRRVLFALAGTGVINMVLFAHHATTHEHYALLLLPYVALSTGTLLFPREAAARPPALVALPLLAVLLVAGVLQYRREAPLRDATRQAERADALAAVTSADTVYVTPDGVPLVFLHRAARHVWPYPVGDLAAAQAAAAAYRERFGVPDLPAAVFVEAEGAPTWVTDLGDGRSAGPYLVVPIPDAEE